MLIEGLSLWWIKRPLFQVWRPVHTQSLLHGREIQKVPRGRNHQVCGGVLWRERHACDGPIREVCLETSRQLGVAQEVKLTRECWAVVGVSLCPNPAFLHGCGRYRGVGPDPGCGCGWFGCQLLHLHKSACELFFFFFVSLIFLHWSGIYSVVKVHKSEIVFIWNASWVVSQWYSQLALLPCRQGYMPKGLRVLVGSAVDGPTHSTKVIITPTLCRCHIRHMCYGMFGFPKLCEEALWLITHSEITSQSYFCLFVCLLCFSLFNTDGHIAL